jgi:hypothetical protein
MAARPSLLPVTATCRRTLEKFFYSMILYPFPPYVAIFSVFPRYSASINRRKKSKKTPENLGRYSFDLVLFLAFTFAGPKIIKNSL